MLLKIYDDLLFHILDFLKLSDLQNLVLVNKEFNKNKFFIYIGKREHPKLQIQSKKDFYEKQLMYISEQDINNEIYSVDWFSKYYDRVIINLNGKEDHLIKEYIKSIVKSELIIKKLTKYKQSCEMDCKIAINYLIEDLKDQSEQDKNDMNDHIGLLRKHNLKNNFKIVNE